MRVRFILPDEPCEVFGHIFPFNGWVDVSDLSIAMQDKLSNNPTFEAETAPKRGRPKASETNKDA